MSATGSIWDTAGEFLVWSRATADESGGRGQVSIAEGETRDDVEMLALPGFYSVISSNDALLTLRRDDGGVAMAAQTARPSGATAGDRGIIVGDVHLRVRAGTTNKVSARKVTGAAPKAVALNGDDCNRNALMQTWMTQVEAAINAIAPGAVTPFVTSSIADVVATSTRLEAD